MNGFEIILRNTYFNSEGVKTTAVNLEPDWDTVKMHRVRLLELTDIYVLGDRWNSLTSVQQDEISAYRAALRDITDYDGESWEAAAAVPDAPEWVVL